MDKKEKAELVKKAISNAAGGTGQWHRYNTNMLLTDGVLGVCEAAGAYWIIDIIASYQNDKRVRNDESLQQIQFWTLKVDLERERAVITLERDTDDVVLSQAIEFTDFPLAELKLYYQNKTVLLPNEY